MGGTPDSSSGLTQRRRPATQPKSPCPRRGWLEEDGLLAAPKLPRRGTREVWPQVRIERPRQRGRMATSESADGSFSPSLAQRRNRSTSLACSYCRCVQASRPRRRRNLCKTRQLPHTSASASGTSSAASRRLPDLCRWSAGLCEFRTGRTNILNRSATRESASGRFVMKN